MPALTPMLPAADQGQHSPLFRLPYELRHRIYQYVLEPTHIHIERKIHYRLTTEGIKLIPPETDVWVPAAAEEDRPIWDCGRLYLDHKSQEYLRILPKDGDITPKQVLARLFRIYHCRSQRPGGPSAVPSGYLDHASCGHEGEQAVFNGSMMNSLRQTCQRAYSEIMGYAVTAEDDENDHQKRFTTGLSRDRTKLELAAHTLHFSDAKDLACLTSLIPAEVSECFHNLSVHVATMSDEFWPYLCNVYLQPWSRRSLAPWLYGSADPNQLVSFYHNHTTHDLADPTTPDGRSEMAEALASDWVVPNIQFDSVGSSWSTKFSMSALRLRSGSPLNLRLSFPLFWQREEEAGEEEAGEEGAEADNRRSPPFHYYIHETDQAGYFDARQWLAQQLCQTLPPISERERSWLQHTVFRGADDDNDAATGRFELEGAQEHQRPGDPGTVCDMERSLCYKTENMCQLISDRTWLDTRAGVSHYAQQVPHRRQRYVDCFDATFGNNFPGSTRSRLYDTYPEMSALAGCQGLEGLELDFFGDAQSPGRVTEIDNSATRVLRDGLVERFTGRGNPDDPLAPLSNSVFWAIGPHPEPLFTHYADPDRNMAHLPMLRFSR